MDERTLKYAKEQLQQLRKAALMNREHKENELKDGDVKRVELVLDSSQN